MKIKHVITTLALAGMLGAGAFAGIKAAQPAREVKADVETYSGSVHVIFENTTAWHTDNQKIALYLWKGGSNTWVGLQDMGSNKTFDFSYTDLTWQPEKMIVASMKKGSAAANWDNKDKQSPDMNLAANVVLTDANSPSFSYGAEVRTSGASWGAKSYLLDRRPSGEMHGTVELAEKEEFKVLSEGDGAWSGFYGRPDAMSSYFSGGSTESYNKDNPNIICEVAGTYEIYFNPATHKSWITRQDIVDADGFADYFLKNVGCDETGVNEPSGWATVAGSYAGLTPEAKKVLCDAAADKDGDNIARCVFWYDRAIIQHPGLTAFMTGRTAHSNNVVLKTTSNNNVAPVAIIIASSIAVVSILGASLMIKRRKEDR